MTDAALFALWVATLYLSLVRLVLTGMEWRAERDVERRAEWQTDRRDRAQVQKIG